MANVKVGLVDGNTARKDRHGWAEKDCLIMVSGLGRTVGHDNMITNANAAIVAAGFTYGSVHPDIPGLYMLGDMIFTALDDGIVQARVTYQRESEGDPNYISIQGGITLVQEKTNKDKDGNNIETSWKRDSASPAKTQTGLVDKWLPCRSLEFKQLLSSCPFSKAATFVGFRNSDTFQGDAAGYWLCMDCSFGSDDGGEHWDTGIKVCHHYNKWNQTIYYIDDSGRPPGNYNEVYNAGNTVKEIEVYGDVAFSGLNAPDVSAM